VLLLEERFFGLTRDDLRRLAFPVAEATSVPHRFNRKQEMAGDKWYYGIIPRHPEISLRQPEPTSMVMAEGFNKERAREFFEVLGHIVDNYKLDATIIFNMDDTSLSTVQKPQKILALRGKYRVGDITNGERGTNTTCMSTAGDFVSPMLIFKRLLFKQEVSEGSPPGTKFACTGRGWITSEVSVQ
jgi:hypothetical protein